MSLLMEVFMPKTIYVPKDTNRSGIYFTWTPSAQRLDIGGWYDSCVGIQSKSFSLSEFFEDLGITEKDCLRAFKR
jgi:hypothetical protein